MTGIIKHTNEEMILRRKSITNPFCVKKECGKKISIVDELSFMNARIFFTVKVRKAMGGHLNLFLYCDEQNMERIGIISFKNNLEDHHERFVSEVFSIDCLDKFDLVFDNHCNQDVEITSFQMMCSG